MIDRIIEFSIRRRWLVVVAGLLLAVWGVAVVYRTPIDAIPDLSESQVVVFADWAGHSPSEIEDQVTFPLTSALQGIRGVDVVRASSDPGFSMINVIFAEQVDQQAARELVTAQLNEAKLRLPPGVTPRLGPDAASTGQIFWYIFDSDHADLGQLRTLQEWTVRPQLSAVPGVAEVADVGGHSPEFAVEVDPLKLSAHGVPLSDLLRAVQATDSSAGGNAIHQTNAEYLVQSQGKLGVRGGKFSESQAIQDIERTPITVAGEFVCFVTDVASVSVAARARRGSLEMDGSEVVGGVVMMRDGENALEVTRRLHEKIIELEAGLPDGVAIVPVYDRTPLIEGAVRTVTGTLVEAIISAAVCIVLILVHLRTSFVIAITLPLAALASFVAMWTLRQLGIADIQTNIMSLAGLVISVGVLVDSSIVMAENVMYRLHAEFGDRPVTGDVRHLVLPACHTVGRPMFFAILIMLLSFLPVFALTGLEGKMFRPLAYTKSFALIAVGVLAITLVPALCTWFVRGRLRSERASWVVRSVIDVYLPVLEYLLDRPLALVLLLGTTLIVGFAPLGSQVVTASVVALSVASIAFAARRALDAVGAAAFVVTLALVCSRWMTPLGWIDMPPLDEGMVMDMPITVPRASITQSTDDMKARNMVLCRFPEVNMVVGKAGRAETPTDPAPLDMIETMVGFRPAPRWPSRHMDVPTGSRIAASVAGAMIDARLVAPFPEGQSLESLADETTMACMPRYDALMREYSYQHQREFLGQLAIDTANEALDRVVALASQAGVLLRPVNDEDRARILEGIPLRTRQRLGQMLTEEDVYRLWKLFARSFAERGIITRESELAKINESAWQEALETVEGAIGGASKTPSQRLLGGLARFQERQWARETRSLNDALADRGPATFIQVAAEELLSRLTVLDADTALAISERRRLRVAPPKQAASHHGGALRPLETIDPHPKLDALLREQTESWSGDVILRALERNELIGFGGELDRAVQMPGWTNVWTTPIQNRVDMLTTGVNTTIGIRVLGHRLDDVIDASQRVAEAVAKVPGAVNVVADPLRGKAYLQIEVDRDQAAAYGLSVAAVNEVIDTALAGSTVETLRDGRVEFPLTVRFERGARDDAEALARLPVRLPSGLNDIAYVSLGDVAKIQVTEGPATIKSENGMLRNYVRLNVRGRNLNEFLREARAAADAVTLPAGTHLEWTGRFKHELRAAWVLAWLGPVVLAAILGLLYWTYRDWTDALVILLAAPGAMAGGVLFQWLFGYDFSVTVWIGYIACFGMAIATGTIMLVYLREAVARAGGLERMSLEQLREAVLHGAVHRLRPKLLTEGTMILGLAPVLWATGPGADVMRPMAAPVLGGILVADEVIDLFLPVLFFHIRRARWMRLHNMSFAESATASSDAELISELVSSAHQETP